MKVYVVTLFKNQMSTGANSINTEVFTDKRIAYSYADDILDAYKKICPDIYENKNSSYHHELYDDFGDYTIIIEITECEVKGNE